MSEYIVFIAMAIAVRVVWRRGLEQALLWAWIPIFLLIPTAFSVNIPGLPDPNFAQAATLPLLVVLLRRRGQLMRWHTMETLLALYFVLRIGMDYVSRGYSDAQNYSFYILVSMVAPYLFGRYLIASREMDIAVSRQFVFIFLLLFPCFIYEAKFWVSPMYKLLGPWFPSVGSGLSLRWGIARTAGPFEHPILACIMIVIVYRLHRWLSWNGVWEQPQTGWLLRLQTTVRWLPVAWRYQISVTLILMALMTISRGPWVGALVGMGLVLVGNARNRPRALWVFGLVLVVGGIVAWEALNAYMTPREGEVLSDEAQTMLYRKEMIDQYKVFLLDRFWTGWGLTTVPVVYGMTSVDNAFFLMALQHGILAPTVFVLIFGYAIMTQIRHGLQAPPRTSPLEFTFCGIYLACFIAFATVYMGAQTEPVLFLLLGWGENLKRRPPSSAPAIVHTVAPPNPAAGASGFRGVIR